MLSIAFPPPLATGMIWSNWRSSSAPHAPSLVPAPHERPDLVRYGAAPGRRHLFVARPDLPEPVELRVVLSRPVPYEKFDIFGGQIGVRPEEAVGGPPQRATSIDTDHGDGLLPRPQVLSVRKFEISLLRDDETPGREEPAGFLDPHPGDLSKAHSYLLRWCRAATGPGGGRSISCTFGRCRNRTVHCGRGGAPAWPAGQGRAPDPATPSESTRRPCSRP